MIKQGDTSPSLSATLLNDEVPIDLAGSSVKFVMRALSCAVGRIEPAAGEAVIDASAVVVGAGVVRYDWADGDTAGEGRFAAEFKVTKDGRVATYPAQGYIPVLIHAGLR